MARIPIADGLGNQVARPVLNADLAVPRGAFGIDGAEQLGDSIARVGAHRQTEEQRAEHAAKVVRDAADRATASGKLLDAQDALTQAHDELAQGVLTGQLDKTKAQEAWRQRSTDISAGLIDGVPVSHRQDFGNGVQRATSHLGRALDIAIVKKDRQDVTAGLNRTLEYTSRLYAKDPAQATAATEAAIAGLGPHSDLAPDQLERLGQSWKEHASFTTAYTGVNSARGDMAALKAWDKKLSTPEFDNLDPQKKAQLLNTSLGYQTHLENVATQRAQRNAIAEERRQKQAGDAFTALSDLTEQGKTIDPTFAADVAAKVKGTVFEKAVPQMLAQSPKNAAFATQPLDVQAAALDAARSELNVKGTSPGAEKQVAKLEKLYQTSVQDYAKEPLRAGLERGVITELRPIDTRTLDGFLSSVASRADAAASVAQVTRRPVSPLTGEEAQQLGTMLGQMPPPQRSSAIAALSTQMQPQMAAAMALQISKTDKALGLALATGTRTTTNGRFTSELILKGSEALKLKTIKEEKTPVDGWTGQINTQLAGVYSNPEQTQATAEAARFILAGLVAEGASGTSDDAKQALRMAVGGRIAEHNGARIPLPQGLELSELNTRLRGYGPDLAKQLPDGKVHVGPATMDAAEFLKALPDAKLQYAGRGRYYVRAGNTLAANAKGEPIVVEGFSVR